MTRIERPRVTMARLELRWQAMRRYRSPRKVSVLPAPAAASWEGAHDEGGLEIGEVFRSRAPDPSESLQWMTRQEVYVCLQGRLGRDLQASRPQLGHVKVSQLLAGPSAPGTTDRPERLLASFVAFPPLAPGSLPGFLGDAGPWLVPVLFPGPLLLGTRACAQPLPGRQGNGHPVGERARRVAGATTQGDRGLQVMAGHGRAESGAYVPAVLVRLACAGDGPATWRAKARPGVPCHEVPASCSRRFDRSLRLTPGRIWRLAVLRNCS